MYSVLERVSKTYFPVTSILNKAMAAEAVQKKIVDKEVKNEELYEYTSSDDETVKNPKKNK